jgi:hypothetical protein
MKAKISKEAWIDLSRKLRQRVSSHFDAEQLEQIDRFIELAGAGASFDQVN